MERSAKPIRRLGLRSRLAMAVAGVGMLAILLNAVLVANVFAAYLQDHQGDVMANQVTALGQCCKSVRAVLALSRPVALSRIMDITLAGTPQRVAVIVDATGQLRYASPHVSSTLLQSLEARLRGDLAHGRYTTRQSTPWSLVGTHIVADVPLYFGGPSAASEQGHQAGALLLAENVQGNANLLLVVGASLAAVVLAVVGGAVAAQAITRPVRALTAASRAIAAGDLERRVKPAGPAETHELALAFNTMVEEVVHQRRVERDLLANVSHELAAPLGLIRGYSEALADGMIVGEEQRQAALHAISAETKRLSRLSGDLLDLALLETGQVSVQCESVPVRDLLAGLQERFTPAAAQAGVTIGLDAAASVPSLDTDGLRLEQVLVNLINNAIRHTPPGGAITLRAARAGDELRLQVADTGAGIPAEDLARVWERFYQVDKGRDRRAGEAGVGLGLAICRSTVMLLGGRIDAASAAGSGTTFSIYLPVHRPVA